MRNDFGWSATIPQPPAFRERPTKLRRWVCWLACPIDCPVCERKSDNVVELFFDVAVGCIAPVEAHVFHSCRELFLVWCRVLLTSKHEPDCGTDFWFDRLLFSVLKVDDCHAIDPPQKSVLRSSSTHELLVANEPAFLLQLVPGQFLTCHCQPQAV